MKKLNKEQTISIIKLVELIEKVVGKRLLDAQFHRDEVEKYFMYILQGKDELDPYQRRDAGVSDEEWELRVKEFKKSLKLEDVKNDKIFDF